MGDQLGVPRTYGSFASEGSDSPTVDGTSPDDISSAKHSPQLARVVSVEDFYRMRGELPRMPLVGPDTREAAWWEGAGYAAFFAFVTWAWWHQSWRPHLKTQEPGNNLNMFFLLTFVWLLAKFFHHALISKNLDWLHYGRFRELPPDIQRKTVTYLLEISIQTIILPILGYYLAQVYLGHGPGDCNVTMNSVNFLPRIGNCVSTTIDGQTHVLNAQHVSNEEYFKYAELGGSCLGQVKWELALSSYLGSCQYIFELFYLGEDMRGTLLMHHMCALFIIALGLFAPTDTPGYTAGLLHVLGVCTEQPTFLALYAYRMSTNVQLKETLMLVGWVTFALEKAWVLIMVFFLLFRYGGRMSTAWAVSLPIVTTVILFAQVWSIDIQRKLWLKLQKERKAQEAAGKKASKYGGGADDEGEGLINAADAESEA